VSLLLPELAEMGSSAGDERNTSPKDDLGEEMVEMEVIFSCKPPQTSIRFPIFATKKLSNLKMESNEEPISCSEPMAKILSSKFPWERS